MIINSFQVNEKILYCERFLEFVRDLLSQLPTRRYFKPLLESSLFIPVCRLSYLRNAPEGRFDFLFNDRSN